MALAGCANNLAVDCHNLAHMCLANPGSWSAYMQPVAQAVRDIRGEDMTDTTMTISSNKRRTLAVAALLVVATATLAVIGVGISLLDAEARDEIANFDDLADVYPTSVEALPKGSTVLLFFADAAEYPGVSGPLYESSGYALIDKDGELLWKGFPGGLAGSKSDLAATVASVAEDYKVAWADRFGDEPNTAG